MPTKRSARKGTAQPKGAKQNGKEQAPANGTSSGIVSWSFLGFSAQIWLLWAGLAIGVFYGWFFQQWKEDKPPPPPPVNLPIPVFDPNVESPWDVVDIPGKGKGAIASRDIMQGELLLREKPLFLVPPTISESPTEYIWNKLYDTTEEQRRAFFDLSYVKFPEDKDPTKDSKHLALAIFETNAVTAGPSSVGIFPRMARLNHGCSSAFNAVYSYVERDGVLLIHALKNITRGKEVLTTYSSTVRPRSERRKYLQENYGFHCTCDVCSLPEEESKASDTRLTNMSHHYDALALWASGKVTGIEAIKLARAIWKLGDEEGYWSERGRLAADAVWVAAAHGDLEAVRQWGVLAMKWTAIELGTGNPLMAELKATLANPEGHRAWRTRPRMIVGNPDGLE